MGVVVVQEGHELVGMGIQKILGEDFVHRADAVLPTFTLVHGLLHGKVPRKVHGPVQARHRSPSKSRAFDEGRLFGRTIHPCLGKHERLRERLGDALGHGRHGILRAIRVRVNPESIDADLSHPPQDVGAHVALQVRVALVHVGHHSVKPTVVECRFIGPLSVWVDDHAAAVVGAFRFVEAS